MIAFLTLAYAALLFILIKIKLLPNSPIVWLSTIVWMVVLFIFLFIPLQWGAPAGPVRILTRAVQIVPNVSGQVTEIAAQANAPLEEGDLLFRVDPEPFVIAENLARASLVRVQAQALQDKDTLANAEAQLKQATAAQTLAQARYDDDAKLVQSGTISANRLEKRETDLEHAEAAVDQAKAAISQAMTELGAVTEAGVVAKVAEAQAALDQASWNLAQTEVRAPSKGYVTNLALAVGQRVTSVPFAPSMLFVDTSEQILVAEINQIHLRYIQPGQDIEIAFKTRPGKVMTGTVDTIISMTSQGQSIVAGTLPTGGAVRAEPFFVRLHLDEATDTRHLLPGVVGTATIYTDSAAAAHVIRKVMIRMESILNYLNPAL